MVNEMSIKEAVLKRCGRVEAVIHLKSIRENVDHKFVNKGLSIKNSRRTKPLACQL